MKSFQKVEKIKVFYDKDGRKVKCFCGKILGRSIVQHMKRKHSKEWENWCLDFVALRNEGWSYRRIMKKYRTIFSWTVIEREIMRMFEERKVDLKISKKIKIESWEPKEFELPKNTVWDFPQRGSWAVHKGDYRGNWSPYIPRTLILKYTKKGNTVLDPFLGGGTTLIEAWLLNRKSIGIDISPYAIKMSKERVKEMKLKNKKKLNINLLNKYKPKIRKGDVKYLPRILSGLGYKNNSIDLICAHPPYLNALRYTRNIEGDLSHINDIEIFCENIRNIASSFYKILKESGHCGILIGDVRKNKKIIPVGFSVMEQFLKEGFELKDTVIKTQHNDESTEFYYNNLPNFLISHEYLFIFKKPEGGI